MRRDYICSYLMISRFYQIFTQTFDIETEEREISQGQNPVSNRLCLIRIMSNFDLIDPGR